MCVPRIKVQYIPRNMHTVYGLLFFVVVIHGLVFPYPSGLLHWHCGNLTIAPVPAKQPWWIWINTSCEFIMKDCITTTKQSTTKPCAYFLGYTVPNITWHTTMAMVKKGWYRKGCPIFGGGTFVMEDLMKMPIKTWKQHYTLAELIPNWYMSHITHKIIWINFITVSLHILSFYSMTSKNTKHNFRTLFCTVIYISLWSGIL